MAVSTPAIFVPGTHEALDGIGSCSSCWDFYGRWTNLGGHVVDLEGPYWWSTALDGIIGENADWEEGAQLLVEYVRKHQVEPVSLVAHSHGGQVALLAAKELKVDLLVTVATPVRQDIKASVKTARGNITHWTHFYSNERGTPWQWLGSLFDGKLGVERGFKWANENFFVPDQTHAGLLSCPELWSFLATRVSCATPLLRGNEPQLRTLAI